MSDPVLPGEGPDPMTDETLAEMRARYVGPLADHALIKEMFGLPFSGLPIVAADARRLLSEVRRLRAEFADFREMAVSNSKAADEAVVRARSECAALTAKAETALATIRECMHIGLQDAKLYDEAGKKRIGEWADFIDKEIRSALGPASGMPRPPAEEATAPDTAMDPFEAADDIDRRWE